MESPTTLMRASSLPCLLLLGRNIGIKQSLTRSSSLPDISDTWVEQWLLHHSQQQQLSHTSKVALGGPDGGVDGTVQDGAVQGVPGNVRTVGVREGQDLLTKLNPLAKEFVPSSRPNMGGLQLNPFAKEFVPSADMGTSNLLASASEETPLADKESTAIPVASSSRKGRRRVRGRNQTNASTHAHNSENILRTVFVCNIDQQVTEDQLALVFMKCGEIVDCRVCGNPNSTLGLTFAFVEFTEPDSAKQALTLGGTMFGRYCIKVMPSLTAIVPLNTALLPQSQDDKERCLRTIYCKNIDPESNLKWFFEFYCGKVAKLRYLENYEFCSTGTALVEFETAESATIALNCSGYILGSFRIRVSPSKTPVWF